MFKGALLLALGFFAVSFPVVAQQAKHSVVAQHHFTASTVKPLDADSNLSIYRPNVVKSSESILFRNGPVRAWSDGGQLVSESAFVQIGMAPLDLFPTAYLNPSEAGPAPVRRPSALSNYSAPASLASDGKDLSGEILNPRLNNVYVTGEVGFMYGQWSGKGSGDYAASYIWGQAGNDKFQISAGGSFENWNGNGPNFRSFKFAR